MDKFYNHKKYEADIYKLWEKSNTFSPSVSNKSPFTIIMPPPNANNPLHIGHARFVAIEDILIRYHRMKGDPTLWLPGADHAGIETQFVFEKNLKNERKSRFDFKPDVLYNMIWDYVSANRPIMENQLKILGSSCDWSRSKFTLDPDIVSVVTKTFKKLFDEGLVYRGERIVNYCPRCGTAFSQLEVDSEEREGNLYFIDYESLIIATTRPETIFADVAVCVNPNDKKYEKLINKKAVVPLINRVVPVISNRLVDKGFGTGALKITPGHDALDFEIGQKNSLPVITVIDNKGRMINVPEKYLGMKALEARDYVINDLKSQGKLVKIEKIKHVVGLCYRDKGLIEPLVSKQWFIKVTSLAKAASTAIKKGEVKFAAKKFEKIALYWLDNLKDWNISRQIVWGIKIPAWYCNTCNEWTITSGDKPKKCMKCGESKLEQDTDTFDTWFSSSQWPFATLQTKKGDFKKYYPTSVMETAYDILPFWVIRMIMMGIYVTSKVPFKEVVIHGLVRDKEGQKISKSKGNVIDPIVMTEKYGGDALRMALVWGALVENDISLSEDNVRGMRNFSNKIWNLGRYLQMAFQDMKGVSFDQPKDLHPEDENILSELDLVVKSVTNNLNNFKISQALEKLYDFAWHNYADSYIEKVKERIKDKDVSALYTLRYTYLSLLRLLHPFAPFVTESIWQEIKDLRKYPESLLATSPWIR